MLSKSRSKANSKYRTKKRQSLNIPARRYTQSDEKVMLGYTLIDIQAAKLKAFNAKNFHEFTMWGQIERGEL